MTCPVCHTETGDHDKRFHRLDTFLRAYSKVQAALVDRVAKLERAAMHCDTCGGRCDGDCEEGDEQFENERLASGQLASADRQCPSCFRALGEGPCSACWAAAPYDILPEQTSLCGAKDPHSPRVCDLPLHHAEIAHDDSTMPTGAHERNGRTWGHRDPAEQPSRQETPGGETERPRPPGTNADGSWADGFNPSGACAQWCGATGPRTHYNCVHLGAGSPCCCTDFCARRAKAKAAELAKKEELADSFVEHMRPLMVTEAGRALMSCTAEPSGTGQLPSAPVVSRSVQLVDATQQGFDIVTGEPIAEPPAPASGTLSPESMLMGHQRAALLRRIDELHALLAAAVRERDEWHDRYESQRLEVLKWQDREEELLVLRRELVEATAKERERCLAWFDAWQDDDVTTTAGMIDGVTTGAPAPGTDNG